jgi:hypothetical protein
MYDIYLSEIECFLYLPSLPAKYPPSGSLPAAGRRKADTKNYETLLFITTFRMFSVFRGLNSNIFVPIQLTGGTGQIR